MNLTADLARLASTLRSGQTNPAPAPIEPPAAPIATAPAVNPEPAPAAATIPATVEAPMMPSEKPVMPGTVILPGQASALRRDGPAFFTPAEAQALVGQTVTALVDFVGVPAGSTGRVEDVACMDVGCALRMRWDHNPQITSGLLRPAINVQVQMDLSPLDDLRPADGPAPK